MPSSGRGFRAPAPRTLAPFQGAFGGGPPSPGGPHGGGPRPGPHGGGAAQAPQAQGRGDAPDPEADLPGGGGAGAWAGEGPPPRQADPPLEEIFVVEGRKQRPFSKGLLTRSPRTRASPSGRRTSWPRPWKGGSAWRASAVSPPSGWKKWWPRRPGASTAPRRGSATGPASSTPGSSSWRRPRGRPGSPFPKASWPSPSWPSASPPTGPSGSRGRWRWPSTGKASRSSAGTS